MKKIKDYILIILFTYMAIIIFLIANVFLFKRPYVELTTPETVQKNYTILNRQVKKLSDSECKTEIVRLLTDSENNSYDGKVKIKDFYQFINTSSIVDDYKIMNEKCNFTKEELSNHNITNRYITKMSLIDQILSNYLYQYELGFIDSSTLEYYNGISTHAYNNIKYNEQELIQEYIKILGER